MFLANATLLIIVETKRDIAIIVVFFIYKKNKIKITQPNWNIDILNVNNFIYCKNCCI